MGRKNDRDPEEMVMTWNKQEELQRVMLNASLFQVASQLTQVWFITAGKKPDSPREVVRTFEEMYEPLADWFRGGSLRDEIKKAVEVLCPTPVGYDPKEKLTAPYSPYKFVGKE